MNKQQNDLFLLWSLNNISLVLLKLKDWKCSFTCSIRSTYYTTYKVQKHAPNTVKLSTQEGTLMWQQTGGFSAINHTSFPFF